MIQNKHSNKYSYFSFLLLAFFTVLISFATVCTSQEWSFSARVINVKDGDSLVVIDDSKKIEIRLWGIDAPEYGQPYSKKARNFLHNVVNGRRIKVVAYYKDKFGRTVAHVYLGTIDINKHMITNGMAWVHPYFCDKRDICQSYKISMNRASEQRINLWREKRPVPPWRMK